MNMVEERMPHLVAELHAQSVRRSLGAGGFAHSAKLELAINLSAEALAKVEANLRGLGYGG